MPSQDLRVISADCHINEPPHVFERVPTEFRDRIPRMMRGADGGDGWSFDGKAPKRTFGIEAMAGRAKDEYQLQGLTFDQILPGNYDGKAHVEDMSKDGVDVSVVYPGHAIFVYLEPDRALALACMRSYNDWVLDEFQAAAPEQLVALPMLPVDDGSEAAVAEMQRVQALGARGCFIPGMPRRPYNDSYYEPLWQAASASGIPLTFHRTFGGAPPDMDWDELVEQNVSVAGIVNRFFSAVRPLTYLVLNGVFDRNPGLRLVAGGGQLRLDPVLGADHGRDPPHGGRVGRPGAGPGAERVPRGQRLRDGARRPRRLRHDAPRAAPPGRHVHVLVRLSPQRHPLAAVSRAHRRADGGHDARRMCAKCSREMPSASTASDRGGARTAPARCCAGRARTTPPTEVTT